MAEVSNVVQNLQPALVIIGSQHLNTPELYKKSLALIKQGAPLLKLTALGIREELVRIKTSIPNDKINEINAVAKRMDDEFASVERVYRKVETA